ncbi:DUF6415 family natural product biosynthesis protein [Streptomyces sp. NPDC046197]|uniref:DUF6415 family natural product biosynthesis protein n=1 Tax=Streptomyces sp. NPDC046197 TaxID=3154337 RepID=UPI0034014C56
MPGRTECGELPFTTGTARAAAAWFLDQPLLLRHETVKGFDKDFRQRLGQLIPTIREVTARLPEHDVPAQVALAAIHQARRRLDEVKAVGLQGEVERVKRLARSVVALCDHYDSLTGVTVCLACDQPISGNAAWLPYDQISPSAGTGRSGRIHTGCAHTLRHTGTRHPSAPA